ncbi:hypothetical protein E1A91_D07G181400v1 [Gossypium mustelinum]|uniref:Small EDRK-rich factor-like N-terminal domain-containing protein n=4 Tax=Gossypium TaxID=3633 RepID=A0A5D2UC68_GOSMU|nr:uncharacterized protein LOC107954908 [Gossypium hirsutum]TYH63357.1 hypothetical protein ES332_D07G186700v1 [Gossypium tomentosum]TYI74172.1 hypothetical protein E1A91_D07G181400v1 [Gossypium mustelinum]TYI74174.1 hypothetical protein E1A91_D07G181400v1 [Gossypium mustelinum]
MEHLPQVDTFLLIVIPSGNINPNFSKPSKDRSREKIPLFLPSTGLIFVWFPRISTMTRGNQREKDRERAQSRSGNKGKAGSKDDGLTPEQRRERDAKALQEKAAKKAAQAAAGGNTAGGAGGSKNKK